MKESVDIYEISFVLQDKNPALVGLIMSQTTFQEELLLGIHVLRGADNARMYITIIILWHLRFLEI